MRAAIRHGSFWAKNRLASEAIDLQALFNDYWSTSERISTVPSQSCSLAVRSYLMAKRRGHYFRWNVSQSSLVSRITILCEHYRLSLSNSNCPSRPANDLRIGGLSALFAPWTKRIVKGILPTDEWIDGGCGERY